MPIYEYQCDACGHRAEFLEKRGTPSRRACPECKRRAFRRLISAAAFHLKGTGWYATDFKTKPAAKDNGKSGDKEKPAGGDKEKSTAKDGDKKKTADGDGGKKTGGKEKTAAA